MTDQTSPETELANKLAATPLDQMHSEWPTIVPVRLSETERELLVNVLRRPGYAPTPGLQSPISAIHDALSAANLEYSGYSCNGVNVVGDRGSINKVAAAFHSHSQIDWYQRNLRHWREECGKLHAKLAASPDTSTLLTCKSPLRAAAERVCWFDWSDNDMDACAAIDALRKALVADTSPDRTSK